VHFHAVSLPVFLVFNNFFHFINFEAREKSENAFVQLFSPEIFENSEPLNVMDVK
jgi:hypothetical protein